MEDNFRQVSLFRNIPAAELKKLAPSCELRCFRRGDVLFKEGDQAAWIWIVQKGWVYLVKRTTQGEFATIFAVTPKDALCGISAMDQRVYSLGAIAATETQLIKVPAAVFSQLLEHHPKFCHQVLLACCNRMRDMAEAISMAPAPAAKHMAYTLLRLRSTFGNTIPVTHHELARMAGIRWETSIRNLSQMKRRGWIASSRGKVTVLGADGLRGLLSQNSKL